MQTILVVDDDLDIRNLIKEILTEEGYQCLEASDGQSAIEMVKSHSEIALILLDVMMPTLSGYDVCEIIRPITNVPIIFLTAKVKEMDKVVGLTLGGDDYITKPFGISEFTARIRAHLRRDQRHALQSNHSQTWSRFGNVKFNRDTMEVYSDETPLKLSSKEFQILTYLYDNAGIVMTRSHLLDVLWGSDAYYDENTVTVHIKNLRRKIDPDSLHIHTIWGTGYKFTR